ncbi:DNA (cytosine-5)-methyltransferase 1 [Micromonospora purpureochromogenes]|uniref:Cytosine-specific methyltransferase n=1 Tax=Micromonospora purpureochromogenes TaxID=47872 RepID=A0A1C5A8U4_9ACTN|nr:DNA (cytosine-5)-methyltransferase 1 [Micromonospora purpureochromogenes]
MRGFGRSGPLAVACLIVTREDQPAAPVRRRGYGVKLVRGPFVRLAPHSDACSEPEELVSLASKLRAEGGRLAADLFSGAGGLSLGLQAAGYDVVLAVDHDEEAIETHRHHHGGLSVDWDLGDPDRVQQVAELMRAAGIELLAGGPPCQPFSKAGRSKIRHRVRQGLRDPRDERRDLWRSFLEIARTARPQAVLMENVPDMALDKEMFILRTMVHELESIGYSVEERSVETFRYGVPQFRQRLILVALQEGAAFTWPEEQRERVTVWNAIGDLPSVEGGWRPEGGAEGWSDYEGPQSEFQRRMRQAVPVGDEHKVFDHITRPVREDDARAFEAMDPTTRYRDLPDEVKRYREDIFDDKYKRLDENNLSRTITAHIAKDGYWYIHPRQNRTITVREAARLQTFPDWFRFAGPPSAAFRQIGNAVPPLLGEHLARAVRAALDDPRPVAATTQDVAAMLAGWFDSAAVRGLPWLRAETRWQVIQAEMLLDRAPAEVVRFIWPLLARWREPQDTVLAEAELVEISKWASRPHRAGAILELAGRLAENPELLREDDELRQVPGLTEAVADLAILTVPARGEEDSEEPVLVTKGVLRVAARFSGDPVDRRNRLTDGRLEIARMIGADSDARRAHLGLVELANSLCRPVEPECNACPLQKLCAESRADPLRLF